MYERNSIVVAKVISNLPKPSRGPICCQPIKVSPVKKGNDSKETILEALLHYVYTSLIQACCEILNSQHSHEPRRLRHKTTVTFSHSRAGELRANMQSDNLVQATLTTHSNLNPIQCCSVLMMQEKPWTTFTFKFFIENFLCFLQG
jgi:hypothetical protein